MLTRGVLEATLAVVTTDYDFQGLWLSSAFNHFFVARDETKAHMAAIGVPSDRITVSGIPVRPGLGISVNREAILQRYDLRPDRPILLISAGAAGGAYTQTIVQQTFRMHNDFQAVVVCGRNAQLKTQIEGLVAMRRNQYRVLGYTNDMPDLIRAATLFVGKPGGLSSSECMAAGLPMVLNPSDSGSGGPETATSCWRRALRCAATTRQQWGTRSISCWLNPIGSRAWLKAPGGLGGPRLARRSLPRCCMINLRRCGLAMPPRSRCSPPVSGELPPPICTPAVVSGP
jgi:hypothetical protein